MDEQTLRAWRWHRQGLDGALRGAEPAAVLEATGWIRTVGGAAPYLGLHARAGSTRAEVDAHAAAVRICELPSARGCTYLLPAAHFATGLRLGQGHSDEAAIRTATKYLGVTHDELSRLEAGVIEALASGPMDPRALSAALGGLVRNLGAEGKKRGQTTTLPLALGRLQSHGRIRRVPVDGRLDGQRYAYTLWTPSPLDHDPGDVAATVAALFFRWIGPATLAQFAEFAGLGVRDSRAAAERVGLQSDGELHALPGDFDRLEAYRPPAGPVYNLVSNLDGLCLFRREVGSLIPAAYRDRPLWSERGTVAGGALADLAHQAILDRGALAGVWDYDPGEGRVVWATFEPPTPALRAEVERVQAWIAADLGDVRSFSLDSPASRAPRLAAIRGMR